jgi:hypothetical protein
MAARLRGALVVDLAASELPAGRRALARAISTGALGPGYTASVVSEGDAVVFDGGFRSSGVSRGRVTLSGDGRASFELSVHAAEFTRVAQAVALAALASVGSTLVFHWIPTWALPLGGAVGLVWAVMSISRDRRRLRRNVRALLSGLPALVGQEPTAGT